MDTLVRIHADFRWLVLAALVVAIAMGWYRYRQGAEWTKPGQRLFSVAMIVFDIQVTIGIILLIANGWPDRFDHPILMLAAVAVGHIGLGRARKADEAGRSYALASGWMAGALVLVVAAIPWT